MDNIRYKSNMIMVFLSILKKLKFNRKVKGKKLFNENMAGYLFAAPWLIGFTVFILGPLIASFYFSFTKYDVVSSPVWKGLENYNTIFLTDILFWKVLGNTVFYTVFSVPLAVFGSLLLAMLLNNKIKGIGVFRTTFYLPSVTGGVAMALLWLWFFDPGVGIINTGLRMLGKQGPLWFQSEIWAKPTMVICSLIAIGGSRCLLFLAALQGIPETLYEAADIDGASWWTKFRYITIPMVSPIILLNIMISIIRSFRVFTNAYVITGGGPLNATLFLVLYIYRNAFTYLKMGYASALAWIFFIILFTFALIQLWLSKKWVYYET